MPALRPLGYRAPPRLPRGGGAAAADADAAGPEEAGTGTGTGNGTGNEKGAAGRLLQPGGGLIVGGRPGPGPGPGPGPAPAPPPTNYELTEDDLDDGSPWWTNDPAGNYGQTEIQTQPPPQTQTQTQTQWDWDWDWDPSSPDLGSFCGAGYTDAVMRCNDGGGGIVACSYPEQCPPGQNCFAMVPCPLYQQGGTGGGGGGTGGNGSGIYSVDLGSANGANGEDTWWQPGAVPPPVPVPPPVKVPQPQRPNPTAGPAQEKEEKEKEEKEEKPPETVVQVSYPILGAPAPPVTVSRDPATGRAQSYSCAAAVPPVASLDPATGATVLNAGGSEVSDLRVPFSYEVYWDGPLGGIGIGSPSAPRLQAALEAVADAYLAAAAQGSGLAEGGDCAAFLPRFGEDEEGGGMREEKGSSSNNNNNSNRYRRIRKEKGEGIAVVEVNDGGRADAVDPNGGPCVTKGASSAPSCVSVNGSVGLRVAYGNDEQAATGATLKQVRDAIEGMGPDPGGAFLGAGFVGQRSDRPGGGGPGGGGGGGDELSPTLSAFPEGGGITGGVAAAIFGGNSADEPYSALGIAFMGGLVIAVLGVALLAGKGIRRYRKHGRFSKKADDQDEDRPGRWDEVEMELKGHLNRKRVMGEDGDAGTPRSYQDDIIDELKETERKRKAAAEKGSGWSWWGGGGGGGGDDTQPQQAGGLCCDNNTTVTPPSAKVHRDDVSTNFMADLDLDNNFLDDLDHDPNYYDYDDKMIPVKAAEKDPGARSIPWFW